MKRLHLFLALVVALPATVLAKGLGTRIDLSVAADGSCQAQVAGTAVAVVPDTLDAKLAALLPNKKTPIRFGPGYETVPYRCFGPVLASLQRQGYDSVSFEAEQPPLGPDVTSPPYSGQ